MNVPLSTICARKSTSVDVIAATSHVAMLVNNWISLLTRIVRFLVLKLKMGFSRNKGT